MMRVAACADVHFAEHARMGGPTPGGPHIDGVSVPLNRRAGFILEVWQRALHAAVSSGCSHFVVAGDLFDSARPDPRLLAAMQRSMSGVEELHFHLLAGNHDQTSDRPGDNAIAPLAGLPNVTVYDRPTFTRLGENEEPFLFVPFYKYTRGELDLRASKLEAQAARAFDGGLAALRGTARATLVTHLGIEDENTPPYLRGASDAILASELAKVMATWSWPLCITGNWHTAGRWHATAGAPMVEQCGALAPTGFDNPGADKYGELVVASYRGDGLPAVQRHKLAGGPRFIVLKVGRETALGGVFAALVEATNSARFRHWHLQLKARPSRLEEVRTWARATLDTQEGLQRGGVIAWEVVPDREELSDAKAAATTSAAVLARFDCADEALQVYVQERAAALPRTVQPARVFDIARGYLGKAGT